MTEREKGRGVISTYSQRIQAVVVVAGAGAGAAVWLTFAPD